MASLALDFILGFNVAIWKDLHLPFRLSHYLYFTSIIATQSHKHSRFKLQRVASKDGHALFIMWHLFDLFINQVGEPQAVRSKPMPSSSETALKLITLTTNSIIRACSLRFIYWLYDLILLQSIMSVLQTTTACMRPAAP